MEDRLQAGTSQTGDNPKLETSAGSNAVSESVHETAVAIDMEGSQNPVLKRTETRCSSARACIKPSVEECRKTALGSRKALSNRELGKNQCGDSESSLGACLPEVHFKGQDREPHKEVNQATALVARFAHIRTKHQWLNIAWLLLVTFLLPAAFAAFWFGVIPINDVEGHFRDQALWGFVVNPGTYVFFSFMLINVFLGCLDDRHPWRPFKYYAPILVVNYFAQVGIIGTAVFAHGTFQLLGFVALIISILVTMIGLAVLPHSYFDCNTKSFMATYIQFVKIMVTFVAFWLVLIAYIIANGESSGAAQGLLTFALAIITFIFKKIFLSLTDPYPIEMAMVIAGLWLENLVDIFITLAYPTATRLGPTFAVIFATRVLEDLAYLAFQLDIWFKFRVWIKSKFKKNQATVVIEDVNPDDRGHSNQQPGYRRRQMRFLAWKLLSQLSSTMFFLVVIPILRFGQNHEFYPYSETELKQIGDVLNDEAFDLFTKDQFDKSMTFAVGTLVAFAISASLITAWMFKFHKDVMDELVNRYKFLIISDAYFGFVLTILVSNVLLAVSSVQVYNRLFFF